MSFANDMRAHLPEALTLPDAFATVFDWAEARGQAGVFTNQDPSDFLSRYLTVYPLAQAFDPSMSHVLFNLQLGPPLHEPPPEVASRVASIARIAGDGGTLALWRDDEDRQRIVVFNHGEPHVLTDDPVVALQFLAIGYVEPGALLYPDLTAAEQAIEHGSDTPPIPPTEFQAFVKSEFGVEVPERASDLGIVIPEEGGPDPIRDWLDELMPEPEIGEIPGMTAENPYIVTRELREMMGDEGVAVLREFYEFVIEEE